MWPAPPWSKDKDDEQEHEWPKLDLLPHHLTRLVLTWTVPYSEETVAEFGDLLDEGGGYFGVTSYSRHRVKHHRIESAQIALDESNDLTVSVQYEAGVSFLSHIPKELEEPAYLLESLLVTPLETPISATAVFSFPGGGRFASLVPLPLDIPPPAAHPNAFDRIIGIHGVRDPAANDPASGHSFTLDRDPTGELQLALDFQLAPGPADQAPERALAEAIERSGWIVARAGR